jgi:hypothetical protein
MMVVVNCHDSQCELIMSKMRKHKIWKILLKLHWTPHWFTNLFWTIQWYFLKLNRSISILPAVKMNDSYAWPIKLVRHKTWLKICIFFDNHGHKHGVLSSDTIINTLFLIVAHHECQNYQKIRISTSMQIWELFHTHKKMDKNECNKDVPCWKLLYV